MDDEEYDENGGGESSSDTEFEDTIVMKHPLTSIQTLEEKKKELAKRIGSDIFIKVCKSLQESIVRDSSSSSFHSKSAINKQTKSTVLPARASFEVFKSLVPDGDDDLYDEVREYLIADSEFNSNTTTSNTIDASGDK